MNVASPPFRSCLLVVACVVATTARALPAAAEPRVAVAPPGTFVAGDPSLVAPSPGARGQHSLRGALAVEYARAPLVLISPEQESQAVVEEQVWLRASVAFSWRHRWLASLQVPMLLRQAGDGRAFSGLPTAPSTTAMGDPELLLRGRVWGPADGFALGAGARASLPLASEVYAGAPGPALGAFVSAGHHDSSSFSVASLGFSWRERQTLPGILPTRMGSVVRLGIAFGVALDGGRSTRVGPELSLDAVVGNGAKPLDPRSTLCQLLVHAQHRVGGGPFEIGLAGGPSLGRAPGAADYRAILTVAFTPEEPIPPPDADGDRVPDAVDMCSSLLGEASEDPLMHGCPSLPSDADGDGMPDTRDACPRTPGEPSIDRRRHGCPPAPVPARGPAPAAKLEAAQIAISEQVQFETGTAVLRPESSGLLEQVADVLRRHPEIESCEVVGHTDDTGARDLNRDLSLARARAVLDWLVAHGVAAERLSARGYGDERPIADNSTEEGRARNRRVEFVIVRKAPDEVK